MGFAFFPHSHTLSHVLFQPPCLAPSVSPRINAVSRKLLSNFIFCFPGSFQGSHSAAKAPLHHCSARACMQLKGCCRGLAKQGGFPPKPRSSCRRAGWTHQIHCPYSTCPPRTPELQLLRAYCCSCSEEGKRRKTCLYNKLLSDMGSSLAFRGFQLSFPPIQC